LPKNSPGLAEKFAKAGGKIHFGWWKKNSATAMVSGKIHQGWRKNPPGLAEKSTMFGGNSRSSGKLQAMLCENFPGNSAAGRLWSCGTPSLARNYMKSFLQCRIRVHIVKNTGEGTKTFEEGMNKRKQVSCCWSFMCLLISP
jgi:hypothetical protein